MDINILHLVDGARQAKGLTVIIDVLRAFSLECYLFSMGAREIRPTGSLEETFAWRDRDPECLLIGERGGIKCEGFDFGNSPSSVSAEAVRGKRVIHTTTAGTQGVVNAVNASSVITGSLVNARAVAEYVRKLDPAMLSLVCMGNGGKSRAAEDELCALYIKSILEGKQIPDFKERVEHLKIDGGERFFDRSRQEDFPERDFYMCTDTDRFDFVIEIRRDEAGFISAPLRL